MRIREFAPPWSDRRVTLGVTVALIAAQIVFIYLLFQIDGYADAVLLGTLHAFLIILLSSYADLRFDNILTLSSRKSQLPRKFIPALNNSFIGLSKWRLRHLVGGSVLKTRL
jgi:hypothetical protein